MANVTTEGMARDEYRKRIEENRAERGGEMQKRKKDMAQLPLREGGGDGSFLSRSPHPHPILSGPAYLFFALPLRISFISFFSCTRRCVVPSFPGYTISASNTPPARINAHRHSHTSPSRTHSLGPKGKESGCRGFFLSFNVSIQPWSMNSIPLYRAGRRPIA